MVPMIYALIGPDTPGSRCGQRFQFLNTNLVPPQLLVNKIPNIGDPMPDFVCVRFPVVYSNNVGSEIRGSIHMSTHVCICHQTGAGPIGRG